MSDNPTKPKRIQRKRTKGWKMPPNTVSATRPGKFGNPFKVGMYAKLGKGEDGLTWVACTEKKYAKADYVYIENTAQAVAMYREYRRRYPLPPYLIEELERADYIACFCALTEPCHVDVLLEIANAK